MNPSTHHAARRRRSSCAAFIATLLVASLLPLLADAAPIALPFHDDFNGAVLGSSWNVSNPSASDYLYGNGKLQLKTTATDIWATTNNLTNLATVQLPNGSDNFQVTGKLSFPSLPSALFQQAGIALFADTGGVADMDHYLRIMYAFENGVRRVELAYDVNGTPTVINTTTPVELDPNQPIWLRINKASTTYTLQYSLDGQTFFTFHTLTGDTWTMAHAGLFALNGDSSAAAQIPVDFDFFAVSAVPATLQACVAVPSGLVSWWSGDGTANDMAALNNGTANGGVTFEQGKVGQAFSFDGAAGTLQAQSGITSATSFSVSLWVKINSFNHPSYMAPFSQHLAQDNFFTFFTGGQEFGFFGYWSDGSVFDLRTDTNGTPIAPPFGAGVWKHLVVTYDGATLKQYVDGALHNQKSYAGKSLGNNQPLIIGKGVAYPDGNLTTTYFDGLVDEFSVYAAAISADQIRNIFQAGTGGMCKGALVPLAGQLAWWRGEGNANDSNGTNNGTLMGGASFAPGPVGQAFSFDGSGAYVVAADSAALDVTDQFTLEAWIKPDNSPGHDMGVISKVGNGSGSVNNGYQMAMHPTSSTSYDVSCQFNEADNNWPQFQVWAGPVSAGAWTHVACTYDHNALKLYINGGLANSLTIGEHTVINSGSTLRLGGDDNNAVWFKGLIDEARIYGSALSASEIGLRASGLPDTTPAAFAFSAQTDAVLGTQYTSNTITTSGLNNPTPISISGGEYAVNGGAYSASAGTVVNGDTVTVRVTAPAIFSGTQSAVLTIGGVSGTFSVTTPSPLGPGLAGANVDFETDAAGTPGSAITGWNVDLYNTSDSGARGANPRGTHELHISDARYFSGGKSVYSYVRNNAGGGGGDADGRHSISDLITAAPVATDANTLYIWRTEVSYTESSRWFWRFDVELSDGVTTQGIELACRAWGYSEGCSGNFQDNHDATTTGADGQIWYRHPIAIPAGMNRSNLTIKIRHQQDSWDYTTAESSFYYDLLTDNGVDLVPAQFSFTPVTNAAISAVTVSAPVTISGVNETVPISITGGEYSVNSGTYTSSPGTAANGDTLSVRVSAPSAYGTTQTATLTIGSVANTFSVSTPGFPAGTIPEANLRIWLTADTGITLDEANGVTHWIDQSGNGFDVMQGAVEKRPLQIADVLGGKPVLRFDGTDDYLQTVGPINLLNGANFSAFVVLRPGITQKENADVLDYAHAGGVNVVLQQSGFSTNAFWAPAADVQQLSASEYQVFSAVFQNGGTGATYLNGGNPRPGGPSSVVYSEPNYFTVGNKSLEAYPRQFNGDIAEVIVYNEKLSDTDRAAVESYLLSKYGLDTSPDVMNFPPETGVDPGATVTSAPVTISGVNVASPISISGGLYAISSDGGTTWSAFTNTTGMLNSGTLVKVQVAASAAAGTTTSAMLTIGAVSTTFNVTTVGTVFNPPILAKWNLLGNTGTLALDVATLFGTLDAQIGGVSQYVLSVWKWVVNPSTGAGKWAYFTPSLSKADSDAAALTQGYDALSTINPGEGFWVNRTTTPGTAVPVTLNGPSSVLFLHDAVSFGALKKSAWHLIATGSAVEPSIFNSTDVDPSPTPGEVPTDNFQTLWAWSAPAQKWYFYAASIEKNGYTSAAGELHTGLDAVRQAAADAGYLDFHTATPPKTLGSGIGFWVRR